MIKQTVVYSRQPKAHKTQLLIYINYWPTRLIVTDESVNTQGAQLLL